MAGILLTLSMIIVVTKSQNTTRIIGCDSLNQNTNTCYINLNYTCSSSNRCSVKCNSNYSNCVINILYEMVYDLIDLYANLHCPSGNCVSCIVNGSNAGVRYFNIYGYECSLLKIDVLYLSDGFINAPGNGGTLILQSRFSYFVIINSVNGTQNMIINIHLDDDWT
eukprot:378339_1